MRVLVYLSIGIFFGIVLFKSEAASWYRIFEMFRFDAFHMYGIIGSALALGILQTQLIKRFGIKSFCGEKIVFAPKETGYKRYLLGGVFFGTGWALVGACPGPTFALLGAGYLSILLVIAAAILGTYAYGILKKALPH